MLEIRPICENCKNIKLSELADVFNASFADYFVKIELNEQSLADKIALENIRLEKSVGAFFDDKLVGFILIGIDDKKSYNSGTGVIPNSRGHQLTEKMYDFILPTLQAEHIYSQQLEVITENFSAIKIYEKIGFKVARTLACFNGKINISKISLEVEIQTLNKIDETRLSTFWTSQPSWQNSLSAIKRNQTLHKIVGAFANENLVGYIIYTDAGRIKQFAVSKDFRRLGIGQTLFDFVKVELNDKEIIITNIDKNDQEMVEFLSKLGLNLFLDQFEMQMKFNSLILIRQIKLHSEEKR